MGRVGAVLNSDLTYIPPELLPGYGGATLPVLNSSGGTVAIGDIGYLASDSSFRTTTTALLMADWCVVVTGGANGAEIIVAVRGTKITVNYTGTAPTAGQWLTTSGSAKLAQRSTVMRPEVFAVATTTGSGGTVICTLLTQRKVLILSPAYDVYRSDSHGVSDFTSTLAAVTTTYNSGSGTYTPTFTGNLRVQCWGGGAGGAGGTGGGGGGGAYSESTISVTNGVGIAYSVGAGGAGGTLPGAGVAGGDTTFGTTTVVAKGATNPFGGAAGSGTGSTKFSGGNGGSGPTGGAGGGSSAGTAANGNNGQDAASGGAGATAPTGGGNGGAGGAVPVAGTAPGGGGGNGTGVNGAAGANGRIVLSQATYGTIIPYSTVTTGNEAAIKPTANTQYGKLVLYNSTRSNSALIDSVDTSTDTITLVSAAPANWAAGDSITIRSTTNTDVLSSAYYTDIDLSSAANTLIPANAVSFSGEVIITDTGAVGSKFQRHPYSSFVSSMQTGLAVQNTSTEVGGWAEFPLIDRKFCIRNTSSGGTNTSISIKVTSMTLAAP